MKFPNGCRVWVEVDGEPLPEFKQKIVVDKARLTHRRTVYVPAEKGKEFVVCYHIMKPRGNHRRVEVDVDGVFADGVDLEGDEFDVKQETTGWCSKAGTRCFTFGDIETSEDSTISTSKEQLMRACIDVQIWETTHKRIERIEPVVRESKGAGKGKGNGNDKGKGKARARSNDGRSSQESDGDVEIANVAIAGEEVKLAKAVHPDSKLASLVGCQIKPGRFIAFTPSPSPPPRDTPPAAADPAAAAARRPSRRSYSLQLVDGTPNSDEGTPSEWAPSGEDDDEEHAPPETRKVVDWEVILKDNSTDYIATFLYRPMSFLIANDIAPDPNRPAASKKGSGSAGGGRKRKRPANETVEQRRQRLEAELAEVKQELGEIRDVKPQIVIDDSEVDELEGDEPNGSESDDDDVIEVVERPAPPPQNEKIYLEISDNDEDSDDY